MDQERHIPLSYLKIGLVLVILATSLTISAQNRNSANLLRDTVYHVSGLEYRGRITLYKRDGRIRLTDPKGSSILFDRKNIDHIGWSDRSRLKYNPESISWDSIPVVDIVHLKDGSVLRGEILAYQQGESLRLKIKAGELVIKEEDIDKIIQEPTNPLFSLSLTKQKKKKVYAFKEKGFYSATVFALLPAGGEEGNSEVGLSLQASFGYQFNRMFGLGIGASIDGYANAGGGDTFLPVFLEARGYLRKKIRTPYWVVAAGYGFPLRTNEFNQDVRRFEGGYMLHPAIGYRLGADKAVNVTFDIGYKFQKALTEKEFFFSGDIFTRDVLYQRLSLRMSVIF